MQNAVPRLCAALVCTLALWTGAQATGQYPQFVVGFSQATTTEPWRLFFNRKLREEAAKHPNIKLIVRDGLDDTQKQIADVEEFISNTVDAILISPKVAVELTPVANRAYDRGIPVIVLDRDLANHRYTQFIGGDNHLIGRTAGDYTIRFLGGPGNAKGRIVEIWGGMKSTPAQDRHAGFAELIAAEPGITNLVPPVDGDWKQDRAYVIMTDILDNHNDIDLVYAHNDPMAYGAYLAAVDAGREKDISFIGIDAIPSEGVRWVYEGILTASFLYMTPGAEAIHQVERLLRGQEIPKRITLPTLTVDKHNAEDILRQNKLIK